MDNFGYALGVVLTDGSVFIHRQMGPTYNKRTRAVRLNPDGTKILGRYTSYRIEMKCKGEPFIRRFAEALSDLTGKPNRYTPKTLVNKSGGLPGLTVGRVFRGFSICVIHKALAVRLMAAREDIRALRLDDYSQLELESMLVAFVDADGYVSPRDGNILIRQRDPSFIVAVCERLNVDHRLSRYEGQSTSEIYIPKKVAATIQTFKHHRAAIAA